MPACNLRWERPTFNSLLQWIFNHSCEVKNLQSGRLEEGKRYPKSNLEPVAQSTLIGHLRLVFFVLKDFSKKVFFFCWKCLCFNNFWHSLIASPWVQFPKDLYVSISSDFVSRLHFTDLSFCAVLSDPLFLLGLKFEMLCSTPPSLTLDNKEWGKNIYIIFLTPSSSWYLCSILHVEVLKESGPTYPAQSLWEARTAVKLSAQESQHIFQGSRQASKQLSTSCWI